VKIPAAKRRPARMFDTRGYGTIVVISLLLAASLPAGQPAGGNFVLLKSTIDGGGGSATGGNFVLTGTVGQPDTGAQPASGGEHALAGGFWAQIGSVVTELIFADGFE